MKRVQCPCCGNYPFENEEDSFHNICPVCFWHFDVTSNEMVDMAIGPNPVSLKQAQKNYKTLGAAEQRVLPYVRKPYDYELPENNPSTAIVEEITSATDAAVQKAGKWLPLLRRELDPLFAAKGFLAHKKHSCYYQIRDDVLSFVLLSPRSYGYECGMYIQPLYIPADTLLLTLGDEMCHMEHRRRHRFALYNDLRGEERVANVQHLNKYLASHAFAWFDKIGSPQGICRYALSRGRIGRWLFAPDVWRYEAKTYSELYLGQYKQAEKDLLTFLGILRKDHSSEIHEWVEEQETQITHLLDTLRDSPDEIPRILQNNVEHTRNNLCI